MSDSPDWSPQRVEQLAPDAAALKAGQGLARPAKWRGLGRSERLIWGECQGSGANPYEVRVDLEDVAHKCSCPSRKLPCKHTLGLLLMLAGGVDFPAGSPPGFVAEWAANRAQRAQARETRRASAETAPVDAEAQARRVEKREQRVAAGLDQLEAWLRDIVAQGLASARAQPAAFWSQMAARLVDAQAPGLARRVRELGAAALAGADWSSKLLLGLARLQLVIDAYRARDALTPGLAAEVRTAVGWTQEQDALREREGVRDRWHVLGRRQTQDEQLRTQHTWLLGEQTRRSALILEFAVGSQPLPTHFEVGQRIDAELVYFDAATPLRALEKSRLGVAPRSHSLPGAADVATLQGEHAARLAGQPWLESWPVVVGPVRPVPVPGGQGLELVDAQQRRIAVEPGFRHVWNLIALAEGGALTLFGEWDGSALDPLTVECRGELFTVARLGELSALARIA